MHIFSLTNRTAPIPTELQMAYRRKLRNCWQSYNFIPCDEIFDTTAAAAAAAAATTTESLPTELYSTFTDHVSGSNLESFFQEHQPIIFFTFIILYVALLFVTLFALIWVLIQIGRFKTYLARYSTRDAVSMFQFMNYKQHNVDRHNHDNIAKQNSNRNRIDSEPIYYECFTLPHQSMDPIIR